MRIAVLFNEPRALAAADEADVLVQVDAVAAALASLGHGVERIGCGLDLRGLARQLERLRPDLAFNLVEGLEGHDRLFAAVPSLLDSLGVRYTGSSAEAIFLTTNKLLAKQRLVAAGLPTPALPARWPQAQTNGDATFAPGRYILKPVWEHGSVGMADDAIVEANTAEQLVARLAASGQASGRACFAEAYVDGRELNLSLLAGEAGTEVLPQAEIDFSAFPAGKPRIVGWAAKWDEGSFEFHHTPRRFDFPGADAPLLAELATLARACWNLFELAGYARVDFRVDQHGRPWILEVNTNPCIAPDAGFAAAVLRAGLTYPQAVSRIVGAAAGRLDRP